MSQKPPRYAFKFIPKNTPPSTSVIKDISAEDEAQFYERAASGNEDRDVYSSLTPSDLSSILDNKQNRAMRKEYALKALEMVRVWTVILTITLIFSGVFNVIFRGIFKNESFVFLSDNVLIALITAATINIFAAFLTVMNNLFPSKADKKKNEASE